MDEGKKKIQQSIIANVVMDMCSKSERLICSQAWRSQDRTVRFTTLSLRWALPCFETYKGKWGTGDSIMFEVEISYDSLCINCVFCPIGKPNANKYEMYGLPRSGKAITLKTWNITMSNDVQDLFDGFAALISEEIPKWEKEFFAPKENFLEGKALMVAHVKYERNRKAREACLAAKGYSCSVCGMNFEQSYGLDFKNIIEVHHIVPISSIGEEYSVNPLTDLVPVCPNCHAALHSKSGGVYTIEELINIRNQ